MFVPALLPCHLFEVFLMRSLLFVRSAACGLVLLSATIAAAAVKLPSVIGDNMVLQRGMPVPIWGWAEKGEEVTVRFAGQTASAKADDEGRWKAILSKLDAGGPFDMSVEAASGSRTVKNILIGEVWICSGQSNMEMGIGISNNAKQEIAAANYPNIRLFSVPKVQADKPATDVKASWCACNPKTVSTGGWGGFSAAAYYFGRTLHKDLGVPVGLIHTSWGGTPAENWTSRKALDSVPELKGLAGGGTTKLYNAMIAPLIPFAIRGAIWYQGEANVGRDKQYRTLFPTMIHCWRAEWGEGDFPFLFVQIAPWQYDCQGIWEAQLMTLKSVPRTGMVVTTDIGDIKDIHPKNKQEVGRRLALWALAKTYGRDVRYSGPIYKTMTIEGNKIRLTFDYGTGMKAADGKPLSYFKIAGANRVFHAATAEVEGDTLLVSSPEVEKPVAVRFAHQGKATPNLVNQAGLPASPFRTDAW
jgi:sialate O-acetylesterase